MNKTVAGAISGAAGVLLLAGAAAGGYAVHRPATRVVTVSKTRPAVTRTETQTATRTVKVPGPRVTVTHSASAAVPCSLVNSGFLVAGGPGGNSVSEGTCAVTAGSNDGNGTITLTNSSGRSTTYALGVPQG
jgi:hypothetical protein